MKVLKDLAVSGSITVGQFLQSSINTDKFLVSESGVVKYRSGSQLLGDIGAAASGHTHTFASLTSKPTTLSGYGITDAVSTATTITINGTTYDLSANRSWTVTTSETDTLATVTGRGATTSTETTYYGGLRTRKSQTAGNYTTAALWTESYDNTATGIAFHISGVKGTFLEMRTNQVLYWDGNTVYHAGNLTNLNQLTNGPGYITGITSSNVTTALGYTPYNSTNPSGYITGITSSMVTTALGYTPYNSTNPNGYITSSGNISGYAMSLNGYANQTEYIILTGPANGPVIKVRYDSATANRYIDIGSKDGNGVYSEGLKIYNGGTLTFGGNTIWHQGNLTNLNQLSNGPGYLTSITSSQVITALGYTPYNGTTNPNGYITGVTNISGYSNNLITQDIRTISPSTHSAARLNFGFTSWSNNNTANYADYIHLRSYTDSSGGADNLIMFLKSGIGMRIWQQTWGSSTAYSSYVDVLHSSNYNAYSPTLTGSGASGTWGISITGNAATVGGYGVSGTVGANTVVIRDVNGYIYANYINSNVSETENPTINSFYTSNGDGWLRKSSLAHVRSQLGNYGGWITGYTETDTLASVTSRGASTTAGITVNGRLTAVGGGTYAVTGSSTQRYIMQALNTSNSVNASYGWWWFHNANGDMGFHADAVGDILTLTRGGGFTINGNAVLTAGNYSSYSPTLTGGGASGTWGINITGSAGSASTSSQVTINYNNDSNSTYQLLWGSGNSVYGTAQVYVNPSSDVIYARGGYISPGNPWGTSDSAYFPNGITTAGGDNWIYGHTYVGNAPANGSGHEFWSNGSSYHRSNLGTNGHGASARFLELQSASGNFIPYSFESEYGNHSWGTVMRIRINQASADRPSLQFSSASNDNRWNIGYCYADDHFRITQNMGYRNDNSTSDGWGTERFRINTDGTTLLGIQGQSTNIYGAVHLYSNNNLYLDNNYGQSIVGVYSASRYQGVFAMGDAYKLAIDGSSTGNLYGLAWSHPNAGGVASNLNTHGLLVMENGTFLAAVSGSIRARDDVRAPAMYTLNMYTTSGSYINMRSSIHAQYNSVDYVNSLYLESGGYGVHLRGNDAGSYGSLRVQDTKNGWYGIYFDSGTMLMMNANESGHYYQGYGWQYRWYNGSMYISTNSYGGGTEYTVLHTGNYSGTLDGRYFFDYGFTTGYPGTEASGMPGNRSAFTYSNGAPLTGCIAHFGASGYGIQLNGNYNGDDFSMRSRNGDAGTWRPWKRLLTDYNYTNYSPTLTGGGATGTWGISITGSAASASNASTVGGLSVHGGRNNEANKIVRTDANGYIQAGWINSDSGNMGYANRIARIQCSDDNYIRYQTLTEFKVSMGLSGKNNYSRRIDYTSDANYHVGSFGHNGIGPNDIFHYGSGFFDHWSGGNGAYPGSTTHIHGINMLHYTTGYGGNAYGWQMASQYDQAGTIYARWCSGGSFTGWYTMITSGNIGSQSVNYASSSGSASYASSAGSLSSMAISQFSNNSGYITSSASVAGVYSSGFGNGNFTWYQTPGGLQQYGGSWASFLISNHGDGSNYYNQTIIMPFWGAPQYMRKEGGNNRGPYTFWSTENLDPNSVGGNLSVSGQISSGGLIRVNGNTNLYLDYNYGCSVVGVYSSYRYQGVFSMGDSYKLPIDGSGPGNLYGMAWSHPNAGGQAGYLDSHGLLVMVNGVTYSAISNSIWARGDITAYSDARVKTNVEVIENAIEKIKAIRGVTFNRTDMEHDTARHAGVIAQEVLEVLPEVVTTTKDGMHSVAYGNLNALLIEAIKEQQGQIEVLKKQIEYLVENK